jgi:hypothetical protein
LDVLAGLRWLAGRQPSPRVASSSEFVYARRALSARLLLAFFKVLAVAAAALLDRRNRCRCCCWAGAPAWTQFAVLTCTALCLPQQPGAHLQARIPPISAPCVR